MTLYKIQGLTADAFQENNARLFDGTRLLLTLRYLPNKWIITFTHNDFSVNGMRLVLGDMCKQYKYKIPFSLNVVNTLDDGDPYFLQDFTTKRIELLVETNE